MANSSKSTTVEVKLQFFAKARELVGHSSARATFPLCLSYQDLLTALNDTFPPLVKLGGAFVLSLNEEFLPEESQVCLKQGDELAVIPPLSGG